MKVLLTGGRGQLGREIAEVWGAAGDDLVITDREELDITDRDAVRAAIITLRPDVVVNTAAATAVDACETEVDAAMRLNAVAVRWLAEALDVTGGHLIQLSTDYVFDGTHTDPYREWDPPAPMSVYGHSKRAGEIEASMLGSHAAIVRTSWLAGRHGANMVATIMRLARSEGPMRFVDDQRGHPTLCSDLAPALRRLALERASGIWHLTNQGPTTWYGLACSVLEAMGQDPRRVEAITTADLDPPRPAPRPANSVLDNAVARAAGWPSLRHHLEPLRELVAALS
jgi:dTDP-4-dehydrorhamnose reductase